MQQSKYEHSTWGIYLKDPISGQIIYDLNSNKMFPPESTTKLFTTAALLNAYGDDYRFNTPIYALGEIKEGVLNGNLVLVGQGDLTLGGRQEGPNTIAYTKMDHNIANEIPGAILTKQNPLQGIEGLARQIRQKGLETLNGDILIDDRIFTSQNERGTLISPIMINENLIDVTINSSEVGQLANLSWRPQVKGYTVTNELKTVSKDEKLDITLISDSNGRNFTVKGTIPLGEKNLVRTFPIKNPNHFARIALIQALQAQGVSVNIPADKSTLPAQAALKDLKPIAVWVSPPLSEYVKLILKVSHNSGANLAAMLVGVKNGKKTFAEGVAEVGNFAMKEVHLAKNELVFLDGAGADGNRLTLQAEIKLLDYMRNKPEPQFQKFFNALPILGVDGSLEDFSKKTPAAGKVHAKPGTGAEYNFATQEIFLTAQSFTGYIEGKNGQLLEYMIVVTNAQTPTVEDILPVFADFGQISAIIYDLSDKFPEK